MSLIQVDHLTFSYPGSFDNVFEDISFQFDTDWKLGFVGRNGRGKTTFLQLLLGRYEYSGTISSSVSFDCFPYPVAHPKYLTRDILQEAAPQAEVWELLRELITFDFGKRIKLETFNTLGGLPVSKPAYNLSARGWYSKTSAEEIGIPDARKGTKAELEQVNGFLDSITGSTLFLEPAVLELIQEEAGAYFAGDRTLDQAVDRVQNRASLYVNERR